MKAIMTLCGMLLFTALNMKAAAQTYQKISCDSVIVREGLKVDTMTVIQIVRINEGKTIEQQVKLNAILFSEMRKDAKTVKDN